MPVDPNSIRKAIIYFVPAFIIYSAFIIIFLYFYYQHPYARIIIYFSILIFGGLLSYLNEKKVVPTLMEIEKEAYYRSFAAQIMRGQRNINDKASFFEGNNKAEFFKTQYDYYIRKTLLTQRLGSIYIYSLMGGILLDISLNSLEKQEDIFRTTLVMGVVAIFSTLFLMIALLKHAEYNAGCAIYRNAILAMDICRIKFSQNKQIIEGELAKTLGLILQNLRLKCKEECKELKEEFLNDGWKTLELLEILGFIAPAVDSEIDNQSQAVKVQK